MRRPQLASLQQQMRARGAGGINRWSLVKYAMGICALMLLVRMGVSPGSAETQVTVIGGAGNNLVVDKSKGLLANAEPVAAEPAFHIYVLGYKRYKSMERLLKSLAAAEYGDDMIALHIRIDGGSGNDWEKSIKVANEFVWTFGPKDVVVAKKNGGLAQAWLTAWSPKTDDERAIILEDDLAVSPTYYRWLTLMHKAYDERPEIAGYTLQRQRLVATSGKSRTVQSTQKPFAYKLLGSWGFAPSAKHWRQFLKLDFETLNPSVPGLITTKWFNRQRRGKMWTQYWIWYCEKHSVYNIYITPPNKKAMASNYRERGVHYGKTRGADFKTLDADEWLPAWESPPDEITLYSWGLKKEGVSYPPEKQLTGHVDPAVTPGTDEEDEVPVIEEGEAPEVVNELRGEELDDAEEEFGTDDAMEEPPPPAESQEELAPEDIAELAAPITNAQVQQMGSDMDTAALVDKARKLESEGILFLQLLNEGFVEITKSWICNVRYMPRVLDRTLFVCTDQASYDQLSAFVNVIGVPLNVHLQVHESPKELRYGRLSYYRFILYRAAILEALLRNGVNLLLVESDTSFFGDPVSYLLQEIDPAMDIVAFHNDFYSNAHGMNGGFLWLKARDLVVEVVRKLYVAFDSRLKALSKKHKEVVGGQGNEQRMFMGLIYKTSANPNADKIKKLFLPLTKFAPGLWYGKNHRSDSLNPNVILNNWIRGNVAKKERAIRWGHWFLDNSGKTCSNRFSDNPLAADSALASEWDLTELVRVAGRIAKPSPLGDLVYLHFVEADTVDLTSNHFCNLRMAADSASMLESTVVVVVGDAPSKRLRSLLSLNGIGASVVTIPTMVSRQRSMLRTGIIYKLLKERLSVISVTPNTVIFRDPVPYLTETVAADADAALPASTQSGLMLSPLALYKPTKATLDHFASYVVGCQKNLITSGIPTPVERSVALPKHFRMGVFEVEALAELPPNSARPTSDKLPWGKWWMGGSDMASKRKQAEAVLMWRIAKDERSCRSKDSPALRRQ